MTYLGLEVLDVTEPSRDGALEEEISRRFALLDAGTGTRLSDPFGTAPAPARPFVWTAFSRAEVAAMRTFLDALKGRAVPFWLPSYQQDLTLAQDLPQSSTAPVILRVAYAEQMFVAGGARRHIALYGRGVPTVFRKITDASDPGNGATELLTLDTGADQLYPADSTVLSFLKLCRLDDDGFEIEWLTGHVARTVIRVREIPTEAPA